MDGSHPFSDIAPAPPAPKSEADYAAKTQQVRQGAVVARVPYSPPDESGRPASLEQQRAQLPQNLQASLTATAARRPCAPLLDHADDGGRCCGGQQRRQPWVQRRRVKSTSDRARGSALASPCACGREKTHTQAGDSTPLPSPRCFHGVSLDAETNSEYWGELVQAPPGHQNLKDSAEECCQACKECGARPRPREPPGWLLEPPGSDLTELTEPSPPPAPLRRTLSHAKKAAPGTRKCNTWVYCPNKRGCATSPYKSCWLKWQAKPSAPAVTRGDNIPWTSGALFVKPLESGEPPRRPSQTAPPRLSPQLPPREASRPGSHAAVSPPPASPPGPRPSLAPQGSPGSTRRTTWC